MTDRVVEQAWRWSVLGLILCGSLVGLGWAYLGLFALLGGAWPASAGYAGLAFLGAVGVRWLCDHRDDLVEG